MCDTPTKSHIERITPTPLLDIVWIVQLDKYTGLDRSLMENQGCWSEFQMSKARVIQYALEHAEDTLFLDSDMVVTGVVNDIDKTKSLGVSPHYIRENHMAIYGFYNGGMLWTNCKSVPEDWIVFTETSRYYDQASIEDLAKKYDHFEFGENYNFQSWRYYMSDVPPQQMETYVTAKRGSGVLHYKQQPLKLIHTHFRNPQFRAFNDFIIRQLNACGDFKTLLIIYRIINGCWMLKLPKQPQPGIYHHTNDSYREMPLLLKLANPDVDLYFEPNIHHCMLDPNIITYDRPTLQWCDSSIEKSTLLLLGNGDITVEGLQLNQTYPHLKVIPWIFWPRKPMIVEKLQKEHPILTYEERLVESVFIGNVENNVQKKHRGSTDEWKKVITEFYLTKGQKYMFTHTEYLMKLREAKFGLCLRGYGSKCHREVELMAFGTVPVVTPEVCTNSYMEPLVEGVHYLKVKNASEWRRVIDGISPAKWREMSVACSDWYRRNVHSSQCWNTLIHRLLYMY